MLTELFDEAIARKASDIHIASEEVPCLRIDGRLERIEGEPLVGAKLQLLLDSIFTPESRIKLASGLPVERTFLHKNVAFNGIVFRIANDGIAVTFRLLSNDVPTLESVAGTSMPFFEEIANSPRGLALIVGPSNSGKTTTAWSVIEHINTHKASRIFVVEAHPSYRFKSKRSLLTQVRIGQESADYSAALRGAHEADLDVVGLDDLPTTEALRQALIVADTGHLVIANLHADYVTDALRRLMDSVPGSEAALLRSLSQNLIAISSQVLFKREDRPGRVAAYERLRVTEPVRAALLKGDLEMIGQLLATEPGCQTLDQALDGLVTEGALIGDRARPWLTLMSPSNS